MTDAKRNAVEKFSGKISRQNTPAVQEIIVNVFFYTPFGCCLLARMKAVNITIPNLANSDGWRDIPKKEIHRLASFTTCPATKA